MNLGMPLILRGYATKCPKANVVEIIIEIRFKMYVRTPCFNIAISVRLIGVFLFFTPYLGLAQSRIAFSAQRTEVSEELNYYLYYPKGYDGDPTQKFPLLLFLHGGGESGLDREMIEKIGPPKMLTDGLNVPMLVLAPQNPHARQFWNTRAIKQLLDSIIRSNRVDVNQIYLTGLSRGAAACWEMAIHYPNTFAAIAVVCGMSPKPYVTWLNPNMGIWLFHGTEDLIIPFSESRQMTDKLRRLAYNVTLTAYEGLGHEIWDRAYNTPELFTWFLEHRLKTQ